MHRNFFMTSIVHEGRAQSGYAIECKSCGLRESVVAAKHSGSLPPEAIAKLFTKKGWSVGSGKNRDVCPSCQTMKKPRLTVIESQKPASPSIKKLDTQVLTRGMTREDKRLIFGKIDSIYLDEKRGYENGWSDIRVANDLGVPRAWVTSIREDSFGPEFLSEEAKLDLQQIKEILARVEKVSADISRLGKELAELKSSVVRMDRVSGELEKLYVRASK